VSARWLFALWLGCAASLAGCCCADDRYVCRVCVAEPSCRYCVEGQQATEALAIDNGKTKLCDALASVAVPGLDTTTGATCVAAPASKFKSQCRHEKWVSGALGGRVW
jgi:hypothetical protein